MSALQRMQAVLLPLGIYNLKADSWITAELSAYAAALDFLQEALARAEKEAFIPTAEDDGLRLREVLFANERKSVSIEDRRSMLLYRAGVKRTDYTRAALEQALTAAGIRAAVYENFDGTLRVSCIELIGNTDRAAAQKAAEEFLPAHAVCVFDFRRMSWGDIEAMGLTFSQMDEADKTWAQIDAFEGA